MEKQVIFQYDNGSQSGTVIESLTDQYHFKGQFQCEGFADYEVAFKTTPDVQLLNCLVHIYHHFEQALDAYPIPMGQYNEMFGRRTSAWK